MQGITFYGRKKSKDFPGVHASGSPCLLNGRENVGFFPPPPNTEDSQLRHGVALQEKIVSRVTAL